MPTNPFERNNPVVVGDAIQDPDLGARYVVTATYDEELLWTITSVWFAGNLRPELASISFEAPGGKLGASMLQKLPLATLLLHHRLQVLEGSDLMTHFGVTGLDAFRVSDELQEVAKVYRAAVEDPYTKSVHAVVAAHFGVSRSTANKKIMRAREADLLPPRLGNTRRARRDLLSVMRQGRGSSSLMSPITLASASN